MKVTFIFINAYDIHISYQLYNNNFILCSKVQKDHIYFDTYLSCNRALKVLPCVLHGLAICALMTASFCHVHRTLQQKIQEIMLFVSDKITIIDYACYVDKHYACYIMCVSLDIMHVIVALYFISGKTKSGF